MKYSLLALRVLRLFDGLILSPGISSPSMDCNCLCLNLSFKPWVKDNYFFKTLSLLYAGTGNKAVEQWILWSNESTLVTSVCSVLVKAKDAFNVKMKNVFLLPEEPPVLSLFLKLCLWDSLINWCEIRAVVLPMLILNSLIAQPWLHRVRMLMCITQSTPRRHPWVELSCPGCCGFTVWDPRQGELNA